MPPPPLPKAAAGACSKVAEKAIEITTRQGTPVSYSDVSRGFSAALAAGFFVVDLEFPKLCADVAHQRNSGGRHVDGFCPACADIYTAVNLALGDEAEGQTCPDCGGEPHFHFCGGERRSGGSGGIE